MLSDEELSMLMLYSSEEGLTESKFGMEMKPGLIQIVSMLNSTANTNEQKIHDFVTRWLIAPNWTENMYIEIHLIFE